MMLQEVFEPQPQEESGPYEEVYKDSSTFLKVHLYTHIHITYLTLILTE